MTTSDLAVPDKQWNEIIEDIINQLKEEDSPEKVIWATEYLLTGHSITETAKKVKVAPATVRRWLVEYPAMAAVLAEGRDALMRWRLARLERQFLLAVNKSEEILDLDLSGFTDNARVDPKILTVVAAQARYIIGLFAGQKLDVTVKHELGDATLKATQDALDYISQRLKEQSGDELEPIEAVYRVIDARADSNAPILNSKGEPFFGALEVLNKNHSGLLCHICGERHVRLSLHIINAHRISINDYEATFMLEIGEIGKAEKEYGNDDTTQI